jgi:hypothetical protein
MAKQVVPISNFANFIEGSSSAAGGRKHLLFLLWLAYCGTSGSRALQRQECQAHKALTAHHLILFCTITVER